MDATRLAPAPPVEARPRVGISPGTTFAVMKGLADIARLVINCHLHQETRAQ
jgi:hypothetical protein